MQPHLTFVQISDSHIGATRGAGYHGWDAARHLERAVETINAFPQPPAFVLHTGDVSDDRSPASYAIAAEILAKLNVPLYVVMGNHDDRTELRRVFGMPLSPDEDPDAPLDYVFEVGGERFVVLDGWKYDVPDPNGRLSDAQLTWLRQYTQPSGPPLTVVIHYPPFEMGSPWLDAHMLLTNGAAFHRALLPARDRLRVVLSGHLHRPSQIVRDGIAYESGPSTVLHYAWQPWDDLPQADPLMTPGYNLVQYFDGYIVVRQHAFERPD